MSLDHPFLACQSRVTYGTRFWRTYKRSHSGGLSKEKPLFSNTNQTKLYSPQLLAHTSGRDTGLLTFYSELPFSTPTSLNILTNADNTFNRVMNLPAPIGIVPFATTTPKQEKLLLQYLCKYSYTCPLLKNTHPNNLSLSYLTSSQIIALHIWDAKMGNLVAPSITNNEDFDNPNNTSIQCHQWFNSNWDLYLTVATTTQLIYR